MSTDDEEIEVDENDDEEPESTPTPPPAPLPAGRGRPRKRTGAGAAPTTARSWNEALAHGRWAELCSILVDGTPQEREQISAPPGTMPEDVEIEVERLEPPGGGVMPRIPGGAIWRRVRPGDPPFSPAAECYRYIVEHYHSRFRQRIGAKYMCTFYARSMKRYITRAPLPLGPFDEIEAQMSAANESHVPAASGAGGVRLPRYNNVGAGSAGGYEGGGRGDDSVLEMLRGEMRAKDDLLRDMYQRLNPGAPVPAAIAPPPAAGAGNATTAQPAPVAFDAQAIVEASTRSMLGVLAELGVIQAARAPVSAPSSIGAGYVPPNAAPTPGVVAGYTRPGAAPPVEEESPRLRKLRQEMNEFREEMQIRSEMREMRDEFDAAGAAGEPEPPEPPKPEPDAPPFVAREIPGPKLYGQGIYSIKENEPAADFAEKATRWAARAPGVAEALGGGIGKFVEGVGGHAISKLAEAGAGFIDRMAKAPPVQVGAGSNKAEVVDDIPKGATDANGSAAPEGWTRVP